MSTFQRVCYFVSDSVNSRNRFAGRYATCMLSAKADRNHRIYYACVQESFGHLGRIIYICLCDEPANSKGKPFAATI